MLFNFFRKKNKNKSNCPFIEGAQVLHVKDGDTIVLKVKYHLTPDVFDSMQKHLESIYPNNTILILDGGADISVMKKNE